MSDLIARLRWQPTTQDTEDAATEIERLREALVNDIQDAEARIDELTIFATNIEKRLTSAVNVLKRFTCACGAKCRKSIHDCDRRAASMLVDSESAVRAALESAKKEGK